MHYIRRQTNKVYNVARVFLSHPNPRIFYEVPSYLYMLIINEMN